MASHFGILNTPLSLARALTADGWRLHGLALPRQRSKPLRLGSSLHQPCVVHTRWGPQNVIFVAL